MSRSARRGLAGLRGSRHEDSPTALLFAVPEAEAIYPHWRGDRSRIGVPGLPLHVTILFPFLPMAAVDSGAERKLRELAAGRAPFEYALGRLGRFPGVLYLAPSPATDFIELTEAVSATWPDYPPYRGAYPNVVPHLTLAEGEEPDGLAAAIEPVLPIRAVAREVLLMSADQDGIWRVRRTFPLGTP